MGPDDRHPPSHSDGEPEPLELPVAIPAPSRDRSRPSWHDDRDDDERGRSVVVIDLA